MRFDWDRDKARRNAARHGVEFVEAATVFDDPAELTIPDPDHSSYEDRWFSIGMSAARRLLVVGYVERGSTIRLIYARRATKRERETYEEV